MQTIIQKWFFTLLLVCLLIASAQTSLQAQMSLTSAGTSQGLSLTTFVSNVPNSGIGPLGTAFEPDGSVLQVDYNAGTIVRLPSDADGQNFASGTVQSTWGGNNPTDLAQVNGVTYLTRQGTGDLVALNNDGTFNHIVVGGMPAATGLAADPFTGHLFVSTLGNNVIWDVDPIAGTKTPFVNQSADGLTLSPDGTILYAEVGGHILGFNTTSKAQVFDSGFINGADGAAAGTGFFTGELFVNTNFGQLVEVNEATSAQTLIGTGGSRGDFVTVDTTNNTLLITQTDRVLRLNGASFTSTPEPSVLSLLCAGLAGLAILRRRRETTMSR